MSVIVEPPPPPSPPEDIIRRFLSDITDFEKECRVPHPPNWDSALEILVDLRTDLGQFQICRDHVASDRLFWTLFGTVPFETLTTDIWTKVSLKCIRNACFQTANATEFATEFGNIHKFLNYLIHQSPVSRHTPDLIEAVTNYLISGSGTPNLCCQLFDPPNLLELWIRRILSLDFRRAIRLVTVLFNHYPDLVPFSSSFSSGTLIFEKVISESNPSVGPLVMELVLEMVMEDMFCRAYTFCSSARADLLLYFHSAVLDAVVSFSPTLNALVVPVDFFVSEFNALVLSLTTGANDHDLPTLVLVELIQILEWITLRGNQPPALLDPAIRLLAWIHTNQPVSTIAAPVALSQTNDPRAGIFSCKKLVVLILAQLVVGNVNLQDCARELGFIPLVLALCNYDDNHPFIREHGIYCLGNLLTGNPTNQYLIKELNAIDIAEETKKIIADSSSPGLDSDQLRVQLHLLDQQRSFM